MSHFRLGVLELNVARYILKNTLGPSLLLETLKTTASDPTQISNLIISTAKVRTSPDARELDCLEVPHILSHNQGHDDIFRSFGIS